MKYTFTPQDIENEVNKVYIEAEDVLIEAEYITGKGKSYVITGTATIEGERYLGFEVEIELLKTPQEDSAKGIMSEEWDWYDFLC